MKTLSGLYSRVAIRIARKGQHRDPRTATWEYPPCEEALEGVGLFPQQHYVAVRQSRFLERSQPDSSSSYAIQR